MSNQVITALSTLGGAVIGFIGAVITNILSNRHATNLEKLKIGQEELRDKSKRDTEIIEVVYQTLIKVDDLLDAFYYATNTQKMDDAEIVNRIKEIRTTSDRTKTLIRLHLPILKTSLDEYIKSISDYWNILGVFNVAKYGNPNLLGETYKNAPEKLREAKEAYTNSFENLQTELEKLVKEVPLQYD